jgi:PAS domain S-box-containing protein
MGPLFRQVLETAEPIVNLEYTDGSPGPDAFNTSSVTSIFPVLGANGTPHGVGAISTDITEKRQAEAALRKSEELRRLFMDSAGATFALFDSELNFLDLNKAGLERFNLGREEVIGKNLTELSPNLVKSGRFDVYLDVIRTGKPTRLEVPSYDAEEGRHRVMDMRAFPVGDGLGVISEDITDRIEAEAALRQTEERWNLFTEAATEGFMLFDADLNLIEINKGGARQYGLRSGETLVGRNLADLAPNSKTGGRLERYREVLKTGEPLHLTGVPPAGAGAGAAQELKFFRVGAGLGVIAEDVTERKRAEGALRESEERRRLFMDSAGEAFMLFDSDLNFIDVNQAALDQFDHTREEVIGKNLAALSPDAVSSGRFDRYLELLRTGETHRAEVTHIIKDGHERIMDLRTFPVGDGMGVISEDITVRKRAERELESLNHRLEELVTERTAELRATQDDLLTAERLAALGQLTATVAHELRNPLGTIRTSVFNLRLTLGGKPDGTNRPLQRIERNISRCDRIISELLDFSANHEPTLETVDLNQCIAAWIDDYEASEGVTIHLAISERSANVRVDQDRLHQVIVNLLDNASQAREASTDTLLGNAKIAVRTLIEGRRFILEVADDGPGIPDDVLTRIFEPLFSTKGFGVGLGLPLVKKIIDQHGGDIKVETAVGNGTTFRIDLPLANSREAAA